MTALLTTIEQAACSALARWLTAQLPPDVVVMDRWPDPDARLPDQAVTVLRSGPPREQSTQPEVDSYDAIHDAVSARLSGAAAPALIADVCASLEAACTGYEAHRVSTGVGQAHSVAADTANALTAPTATNLATGITRANDLLARAGAHLTHRAHAFPDGATAFPALAALGAGATLAALAARTIALRNAIEAHYAARIYTWRLADVEQPVQLDVWATKDVLRDDLMARLVPLLHAGEGDSAAVAGIDADQAVRAGTLLALADGWTGYADAEFDAPTFTDTSDTVKRSEYRATYRGTLSVWRLVKHQSPRITRATLSAPRLSAAVILDTDGTTPATFTHA